MALPDQEAAAAGGLADLAGFSDDFGASDDFELVSDDVLDPASEDPDPEDPSLLAPPSEDFAAPALALPLDDRLSVL